MKTISTVSIFSLLLLLTVPTNAGTIKGRISAEVKQEGSSEAKGGSYGSRKFKFLEQVDYSRFKDFVVSICEIEVPLETKNAPRVTVAQQDGTFIPHVIPVASGTEIEWQNRDEIFHNVFSISEAKPFDLGYYKSTDNSKAVVFVKPGRVDVFCSIHSQMNCIVLVMPNPWFATSDRRGNYEIKNIPPGAYQLKAWHERLPPKYLEITVPKEGTIELDIVMGLSELPKF
jgi:plastocyanin